MYIIMCLVIFFPISLATGVTIFRNIDYRSTKPENVPVPLALSKFPWKFKYQSGDRLIEKIYIEQKCPSVTAIEITYYTEEIFYTAEMWTEDSIRRKCENYYTVDRVSDKLTIIKLYLCTSNIIEYEYHRFPSGPNECRPDRHHPHHLTCVLVVDLGNTCKELPSAPDTITDDKEKSSAIDTLTSNRQISRDEDFETTTINGIPANAKHASPLSAEDVVLIYVIPSMLVTCVITLMIYIGVIKYGHRNSYPAETIDLNTYVTPNELVYADLSLAHRDSEPPRRDEEPKYARIIGVLKPQQVTPNEVVYADLSFAHRVSEPPRRDEESKYGRIIGVLKPVDANNRKK